MKIVLFTHKDDIDGAGCEVLAKAAFSENNISAILRKVKHEVEVFPCSYGDLDEKVANFIDSGELNDENTLLVFITDMCPKKETLEKINGELYSGKFQILDHHDHPSDFNDYEFFFSQQKDEVGLTSATSIFYNWLVEAGYIEPTKVLNEFTERTRRADTWEWKTIYDDTIADDMSELFNCIGYGKYVDGMLSKIQADKEFKFTDEEKEIIAERRKKIAKAYETALAKLEQRKVCNVDGVKVAVVDIEYEFRSGFSQYLRDINFPADIMAIADFDNNRMSYRYLNPQVDVGAFARKFGGGGRSVAAGSPITDEVTKALDLNNDEKDKN